MAERRATDSVAALGIDELSAYLAFHALAVAVVDLGVGLLLTAGRVVPVEPSDLLVRFDGASVVDVVVPADNVAAVVHGHVGHRDRVDPDAAERPGRLASWLVLALGPLVAAVEPVEPAPRWGAVADLVAILALVRQRAHDLPADEVWSTAMAVVDELRSLRPHPAERPTRLAVPSPSGGEPLLLARRSTCCQWYRAARRLDEASVADARCADCPSLEPGTNVARLAMLAYRGDLAAP